MSNPEPGSILIKSKSTKSINMKNPNKQGKGVGGMAPPNKSLAKPSQKGAGRPAPKGSLKKGGK